MMKIVLDGNDILNREDFFEVLNQSLDFPDYFGNNLDALADILSETDEEYIFECRHYEQLADHLGSRFTRRLRRMARDMGYELKFVDDADESEGTYDSQDAGAECPLTE